jgi:hypothetical protein
MGNPTGIAVDLGIQAAYTMVAVSAAILETTNAFV